jgi:hypothetical protein
MSQRDSRRPKHSPATAARVFSGEAVVITPSDNTVRMFNAVGSRIWELIDGQRTMDDIVEVLVEEYAVAPDTARASLEHFVEELEGKGLIEVTRPDPEVG